jgi:hypothetical protein
MATADSPRVTPANTARLRATAGRRARPAVRSPRYRTTTAAGAAPNNSAPDPTRSLARQRPAPRPTAPHCPIGSTSGNSPMPRPTARRRASAANSSTHRPIGLTPGNSRPPVTASTARPLLSARLDLGQQPASRPTARRGRPHTQPRASAAGAVSDRVDLGQQPDAAPNSSAAPALANSSTQCPIGLTSGSSRHPPGDAGQHGGHSSTAAVRSLRRRTTAAPRPTARRGRRLDRCCPLASTSDNSRRRAQQRRLLTREALSDWLDLGQQPDAAPNSSAAPGTVEDQRARCWVLDGVLLRGPTMLDSPGPTGVDRCMPGVTIR